MSRKNHKTIAISPFDPISGSLGEQMTTVAKQTSLCLRAHFEAQRQPDETPSPLITMAYEAFEGGKGIRGFLVLLFAHMMGTWQKNPQGLLRVATAVEMIHAYSLIHDDLPCMDNSDIRRAKPSLHRVYGVANAMMTGNLLVSEALSLLCFRETNPLSRVRLALVALLCDAIGARGLLGGQYLDLSRTSASREHINSKKTVKLFKACALLAAADGEHIAANVTNAKNVLALAGHFGHLFQTLDDCLDWKQDHNPKILPKHAQECLFQDAQTHLHRLTLCAKNLSDAKPFQPVLQMMETRFKTLESTALKSTALESTARESTKDSKILKSKGGKA